MKVSFPRSFFFGLDRPGQGRCTDNDIDLLSDEEEDVEVCWRLLLASHVALCFELLADAHLALLGN